MSSNSTTTRVAQAGILSGKNPVTYDSSNPILIFIIQVRTLSFSLLHTCNLTQLQGWHHYHFLLASPLAAFQDPPTPRYRRSSRRHSPGPISTWPYTQFYQYHLPHSLNSNFECGRQFGIGVFPISRRSGNRCEIFSI